MDALTDRVEEYEREHFDDVLSIREEITIEVGTLQATIDGLSSAFVMQLAETRDISRSVDAIIGGRLSAAVTATGGSQQQSVGLAIAAIQIQHQDQQDNERLRDWVTESMIAARRNREEATPEPPTRDQQPRRDERHHAGAAQLHGEQGQPPHPQGRTI